MSAVVDERVTDEVEALSAILLTDVTVKTVGDVPDAIETTLHPTLVEPDKQYVCVTLGVKITPEYPDKRPEVYLRNPRGLDDDHIDGILAQIDDKLNRCLGQPVVFELIEMVRDILNTRNLPSGQCAICLFDFVHGDVFIKTQCYHHYHSYCLSCHLTADKENYEEDKEKLPYWQQVQINAYEQTCPVCRSPISFNIDDLKSAPPSIESENAPPFVLTEEMKATQKRMAELYAVQKAKGGLVCQDDGPAPLAISTVGAEKEKPSTSGTAVKTADNVSNARKPDAQAAAAAAANNNNNNAAAAPDSPQRQQYRGPYRGFNRRGKPGKRGRGMR